MATVEHTPFKVTGKTALVTGAGSGINLAFAKLLLELGCNVVIADLALRPEAEDVVKAYTSDQASSKARAVFVRTDVTNWDQLTAMFDVADKEFGGADIVVPGAGIFEPHWSNFWHPPGSSTSKDSPTGLGHYATLDINITHPIRTTQIAISRWLSPPAGSRSGKASPANPKRVIHISSIACSLASLPVPLYHASKHAIKAFVMSLAELDDALGIRVNGVAPGVIRTPLWLEHPEKMPLIVPEQDSWILPEEVALEMLRCCEDESRVGGYLSEVLKGQTRRVEILNDPGPDGLGASVSGMGVLSEEVLQWLAEPGWGVTE